MPYLRMFLNEMLLDELFISEVYVQSVLGNHFIDEEKQRMRNKHLLRNPAYTRNQFSL